MRGTAAIALAVVLCALATADSEGDVAALKELAAKLKQSQAAHKAEVSAHKAEVSAHKAEVSALQSKHKAEVSALQSNAERSQARIRERDAKLTVFQNRPGQRLGAAPSDDQPSVPESASSRMCARVTGSLTKAQDAMKSLQQMAERCRPPDKADNHDDIPTTPGAARAVVSCHGTNATFTWLGANSSTRAIPPPGELVLSAETAQCSTNGLCSMAHSVNSGVVYNSFWLGHTNGTYVKYEHRFYCWETARNFESRLATDIDSDGDRWGREEGTEISAFALDPQCHTGCNKYSECQLDPVVTPKCTNQYQGGANDFLPASQAYVACSVGYPVLYNAMQNVGGCMSALRADESHYFSSHFQPYVVNKCVGASDSFRRACTKNQIKWTSHHYTSSHATRGGASVDVVVGASLCVLAKLVECFLLANGHSHCTTNKKAECRETCYSTVSHRSYNGGCVGGREREIDGSMLSHHTSDGALIHMKRGCCFQGCTIPNGAPQFMLHMRGHFCIDPTTTF